MEKQTKKKPNSFLKIGVCFFIISGLIGQFSCAARANPIKNIHQAIQQKVYFSEVNGKVFTHTHIPKTKALFGEKTLTPLVPKTPSPANSRARGTLLFRNAPKPDFDREVFKRDIKKIEGYIEKGIGKKVVKRGKKAVGEIIKTVKGVGKEIKLSREGKKTEQSLLVKVRGAIKEASHVFRAVPKEKAATGKVSPNRNLFAPDRQRLGTNQPTYPLGLKKEKRF